MPRVGQGSGALSTGLFSALLLLSFLSWAESWCQPCLIHHLCLSFCIEQAMGTFFFFSFVLHLSARSPEAQRGFWGNVCAVSIRIFLVKGKQATEMLFDNLHRPATALVRPLEQQMLSEESLFSVRETYRHFSGLQKPPSQGDRAQHSLDTLCKAQALPKDFLVKCCCCCRDSCDNFLSFLPSNSLQV